jgi:tetratricopeptide (TPR) repeat protein
MASNLPLNYARCTVLILLALASAACLRRPEYYVKRGNQFAAQGKYNEAELNYRNAIQKNANFGEAFYQLALTELNEGKVIDAYRNLARAVQLMPQRDDVKAKMADLSLSIALSDRRRPKGPWDEAAKLADGLLAKDPKSFDGLRLKGHMAAAGQKLKDAEQFYYRALAIKPMNPEVTLGLAQVLFEDAQSKQAEELAMGLIAKNKTYTPIYDLLIQRRLAAKDLAGTEQILKTKRANNPSDTATVLEIARFYAGSNREADMKAVLQQMLDDHKSFPQAPLLVGDFYARLRRLDDARKQYDAGVQANSAKNNTAQRVVYLKRIANLALVQGKRDDAAKVVDEVLKAQPDDLSASMVKASLLITNRTPADADKAVAILRPLVAKNGNNANLHYTLGRALGTKGDLDAARPEFLAAIQKNANFIEPRLALAEMAQLKGDFKTALRYTNEILAINPNLSRVRVLHAVSLIYSGNAVDGRRELTTLERANPQDRELQLQMGVLELHDKHFKEAEEYFRKLSANSNNDVRPLSGLTQTLASEGQLDKAVALLQEETKKAPNNNQVRYLYAVTAAMAGRYDVALAEFQHLVAVSPQPQLYLALGNVYRIKKDYSNALANLEKSAQLAPKDPSPVVAEAEVLDASGHTRESLDKYRAALRLAPNNATLLNNVAYLLADTGGSLDEALKYARRAVELDSKQPRYSDTLGWVYYKQNLNDTALQVFRGLTETNPDNPTFHYHFAMVLLKKGDKATAKMELQNALSKKPSDEVRHDVEAALSKLG